MSYKSLIKSNIKSAFKLVGDLAKVITLTKINKTGFDFDNLSTTKSASTVVTLKGIVSETKKGEHYHKVVTFDTSDIGDFTEFDKVTIDGEDFVPTRPFKHDEFLTIVTIVKGA